MVLLLENASPVSCALIGWIANL